MFLDDLQASAPLAKHSRHCGSVVYSGYRDISLQKSCCTSSIDRTDVHRLLLRSLAFWTSVLVSTIPTGSPLAAI